MTSIVVAREGGRSRKRETTTEKDVKTKTQRARVRRNGGRPSEKPERTPLEHVLAVMRDETQPDALRVSMAKAAMPYLHRRCAGSPPPEEDVKETPQWSDLELAQRIAHILNRANVDLENPAETPHG
jgi:hypothetical protein